MTVSLDPRDYVGKGQDGVWEVDLEARLRTEPEVQRAEFLSQVLALQERSRKGKGLWFRLAKSLLTTSPSYDRLLRASLAVADASSIKVWLECCVQRMGMRGVLSVLRAEDATHPQRVDLTTYWLPRLARTPKEQAAVKIFMGTRATSKR